MSRTTQTDETQIQRAYAQLTFLGLLLHTIQALVFFRYSLLIPAVYNCFSVAFYILMLYFTHRKMYRVTVCSIHIECCLFAIFCVISCGWGSGIELYLLAMSSLVYFCPFNHKFVAYIFSIVELTVFMVLRIYTYYHNPIYGSLPKLAKIAYYIFNTLACFFIILYASYSSNISAVVTNIRLRSENKNLSAMANSDFLTALPSRRSFFQSVKALSPDTPVIAAIGDLDDFKNINDSFGHNSGDYVLRTVGHLINSCCDHHSIACRWGGEEFVILFHNYSLSDAVADLENLRDKIAAYAYEYDAQVINATITFGVYSGSVQEGVEALINEADKYLYNGKQNGKNCVISSLEK